MKLLQPRANIDERGGQVAAAAPPRANTKRADLADRRKRPPEPPSPPAAREHPQTPPTRLAPALHSGMIDIFQVALRFRFIRRLGDRVISQNPHMFTLHTRGYDLRVSPLPHRCAPRHECLPGADCIER